MTRYPEQFGASSPVVTLLSQPCHQTQLSAGTFGRCHSPRTNHKTTAAVSSSPLRWAGRKRCRDEAWINLEPDSNPAAATDSTQAWVNGDGMALMQPANGQAADGSNPSGTWVHGNLDKSWKSKQDHQTDDAELRSHKSQRLDGTAEAPHLRRTPHQPASQASHGAVPSAPCHESVVIDDFTVHLGIGWRSIRRDEHIQAAARGWARFIENNFGLAGVRICLESKGLQSYLVEASSGYFLFAENLRQGRLVSRTAEGALQNLQLSPPRFEGPELDLLFKTNGRAEAFADSAMALDW